MYSNTLLGTSEDRSTEMNNNGNGLSHANESSQQNITQVRYRDGQFPTDYIPTVFEMNAKTVSTTCVLF